MAGLGVVVGRDMKSDGMNEHALRYSVMCCFQKGCVSGH